MCLLKVKQKQLLLHPLKSVATACPQSSTDLSGEHYLIQYYHLDMVNLRYSFLDKIQDSARGSDHHMHYTRFTGKKEIQNLYTFLLIYCSHIHPHKNLHNFVVCIQHQKHKKVKRCVWDCILPFHLPTARQYLLQFYIEQASFQNHQFQLRGIQAFVL